MTEQDFSFLNTNLTLKEIEQKLGKSDGGIFDYEYIAVYKLKNGNFILLKFNLPGGKIDTPFNEKLLKADLVDPSGEVIRNIV